MFSDDIGRSWQPLLTHFPVEPACLNRVNLDYNVPGTFYASTCQGLYHWTGQDWILVSSKQTGTVAVVPKKPRVLWAAEPFGPVEVPVVRSDNGGGTWTHASRYLNHANGVATLLIDPRDTERLYAVVWPQYAGSHLRIGSANGQWTDLPGPLDNSPIGTGLVQDGDTGTIYVVVNSNQLWRTKPSTRLDHNTIQWEKVHDFDQDLQVELIGAGWRAGELALFVNLSAVARHKGLPVLHRSLDRGQTWQPVPVK